jgi:hypothetical protein
MSIYHGELINDKKLSYAYFIPITWLMFSLGQWENLLWGWQIQIIMAVFFFILTVYLIGMSEGIDSYFVFAIISGIVASYSFANGLLVWPIVFIQIIFQFKLNKTRKNTNIVVWALAGSITIGSYFIDYVMPSSPSLLYFLYHLSSSLEYYLSSLGSSLSSDKYVSCTIGLLLVILYIYAFAASMNKNTFEIERNNYFLMPLSLILFALFSALLLVLGRSVLGPEQALSSRYTTFTVLGVIGTYILYLRNIIPIDKNHHIRFIMFGFLLSLIVLGIISTFPRGIEAGINKRNETLQDVYYLSTVESRTDDQIKMLYPDPAIVRNYAKILEKYDLSVFNKPGMDNPG